MNSCSDDEIGSGDRDRLWSWGIHEDQMATNWIVVFALVETILVSTAIDLQSRTAFAGSRVALSLLLNLTGLIITGLLWYVITLHHQFIRVIRIELRSADPLYDKIRSAVEEARSGSLKQGKLFRGEDPLRVVLLRVIVPLFMVLWVALLAVALI